MKLYPPLANLVSSFLVSTNKSVFQDILRDVIDDERLLCVCTIALAPFLVSVTKVEEHVFVTMSRYLLKDWVTVMNTQIDNFDSVFTHMRQGWLDKHIHEPPFAATNTEVVVLDFFTSKDAEELAVLLGEINFP